MADTQETGRTQTGAREGSPPPANDTDDASANQAVEHAQDVMDTEQAQGFQGVKVDPTPDEHYTVAGVLAGKPTPETDQDAHHEAHFASRLADRFPATPEAPARPARRGKR